MNDQPREAVNISIMPKYSKQIKTRICQLIKTDSYTIAEICKIVGIAESTYFEWQDKKPEFSDAIKRARDHFKKNILVECEKSLIKLIYREAARNGTPTPGVYGGGRQKSWTMG